MSVAANIWLWRQAKKPGETKVETHVEYVLIKDSTPTLVESHLTGETMTVKAAIKHPHATDHEPDVLTKKNEPDTVATVSITGDSATVTLPIEQRVYEDSLYTAYLSGYRPRLDSISLRMPHTYTTITKTVKGPAKRFAIGPTIGAGYGVFGKRFDVYVGVSMTWNLLP
jgi:hypothetical protein